MVQVSVGFARADGALTSNVGNGVASRQAAIGRLATVSCRSANDPIADMLRAPLRLRCRLTQEFWRAPSCNLAWQQLDQSRRRAVLKNPNAAVW
jgi:hypothetical protein